MTTASALDGARVAIANRGEIAIRIAVTVRRLGGIPVALLGDPDLHGLAAREIGIVEPLGPAGSELDVERVVRAASRANTACLHPGYGFLSERAELSQACLDAGITFVGPAPATLRLCGDKLETRAAAVRAGVPVLAASEGLGTDESQWLIGADQIGYPLLVKLAGAGGGRGLRHVGDRADLVDAVRASLREGASSGSAPAVYLERELINPRHVEVQVAASVGDVVVVGDRDCSLQRRHQKVIEEAPAPNLDQGTRNRLHTAAANLAREVSLTGIATCEFLLSTGNELAFLEINPRIQVEHPVTELVTGIDLVDWQLRIAAGQSLPCTCIPEPRGHAIEARVYAESPERGFLPSSGALTTVAWPAHPGLRLDIGYATGDVVPTTCDAMLAKVISHGPDREAARTALGFALGDTVIAGVGTNLAWLRALLGNVEFRKGNPGTALAITVAAREADPRFARVAVLAQFVSGEGQDRSGAWGAIGAWRQSGGVPITLHGDDWETRYLLSRQGDGWLVDDGRTASHVRWIRDPRGFWVVNDGSQMQRVAVHPVRDGFQVTAGGGGDWLVRVGPRPLATTARSVVHGNGNVIAPMPGSVVAVLVAPGERVLTGQSLVTLTAMKMELACEAPFDGIVATVTCEPGQQVDADEVLVTIGADAPGKIEPLR